MVGDIYLITQLAVYTTYIPLIYCQLGASMLPIPPIKGTRKLHWDMGLLCLLSFDPASFLPRDEQIKTRNSKDVLGCWNTQHAVSSFSGNAWKSRCVFFCWLPILWLENNRIFTNCTTDHFHHFSCHWWIIVTDGPQKLGAFIKPSIFPLIPSQHFIGLVDTS